MNWEKLTAPDFEKGIEECKGVCLLPVGVIEKHGDHLPLGQDSLFIHKLCTQAAEIEQAMVFPFFYFSRINEALHQPGVISLKLELLLPLIENVCDEISRNGFKKIILVNGHGGNVNFLRFFMQNLLDKDKDYMVMTVTPHEEIETDEVIQKILSSSYDGHGGESETSCACYYYPELVKDNTPASYGASLDRLADFRKLKIANNLDWYSKFPGHLACDQTPGSAEKGEVIISQLKKYLCDVIKCVKENNEALKLLAMYRHQAKNPATDNTNPK